MKKTDLWITITAMMVLMAACQDRNQIAALPSPTVTNSPAPTPMTDKWLGRWPGAEGTYLDLARNGDKYVVIIADLDGPKTYEGVAAGDHLAFKRGGKTESIRATNGKGTGMKWLLDEKNCLVVTVGSEGFCRK